jgi:hypothetical protein
MSSTFCNSVNSASSSSLAASLKTFDSQKAKPLDRILEAKKKKKK